MTQTRTEVQAISPTERLEELRKRYPIFRYDGFLIVEDGPSLRIEFQFTVPPDLSFRPKIVIHPVRSGSKEMVENLVFHLGLVEAISYWKATCSPVFFVGAGRLNSEQISWWSNLLINGMGEFYFVNDIDFTSSDFVTVKSDPRSREFPNNTAGLSDRSLLPIGGGRDSALAAKVLFDAGKSFSCMMLNPTRAAQDVASAVGCDTPIIARRTIDPLLLDLNKKGFLNGHTPFSAYLAFLSALSLILHDCRNIIVANERSSDEGNLNYRGRFINHQYSKSEQFELDFEYYLQRYLIPHATYFSFIRSLYELQVGKAFSRYRELFSTFKSCNRNREENSWCGACPKCLSVFMTTYPFVSREDTLRIFGRDFFEDSGSIPIIRKLAGLEGFKPFECVSTIEEALASLYLCIQHCQQSAIPLPKALQSIQSEVTSPAKNAQGLAITLLAHKEASRNVPSEFRPLLESLI
jgi:UDP-N-acetyl-alpha-D-muramoyl-L-alanyl-L-glutamate epimerase